MSFTFNSNYYEIRCNLNLRLSLKFRPFKEMRQLFLSYVQGKSSSLFFGLHHILLAYIFTYVHIEVFTNSLYLLNKTINSLHTNFAEQLNKTQNTELLNSITRHDTLETFFFHLGSVMNASAPFSSNPFFYTDFLVPYT